MTTCTICSLQHTGPRRPMTLLPECWRRPGRHTPPKARRLQPATFTAGEQTLFNLFQHPDGHSGYYSAYANTSDVLGLATALQPTAHHCPNILPCSNCFLCYTQVQSHTALQPSATLHAAAKLKLTSHSQTPPCALPPGPNSSASSKMKTARKSLWSNPAGPKSTGPFEFRVMIQKGCVPACPQRWGHGGRRSSCSTQSTEETVRPKSSSKYTLQRPSTRPCRSLLQYRSCN